MNILTVLSEREQEVFRLLAFAHTRQEIADELGITRRTASTHVSSILDKFYIRSAHVPTLALAMGLVTLEELLQHLPEGTQDLIEYSEARGDEYVKHIGDASLEKIRAEFEAQERSNGATQWDPKISFDGAVMLLPRNVVVRIEVE